jgi:hypothetical protein
MNHIARSIALAAFFVPAAFAQTGPSPTPPAPLDLKSPTDGIHSAPTPVDINGNPIPPEKPTAAELEADRIQRLENQVKADQLQAEKDRQVAEENREEDERRAAEQLAAEQKSHDQAMVALYVGLALLAAGVGTLLFRRKSP